MAKFLSEVLWLNLLYFTYQRKSKEEIEEKERDAELVERLAKREQLQTEADIRLEQQAKYVIQRDYYINNNVFKSEVIMLSSLSPCILHSRN